MKFTYKAYKELVHLLKSKGYIISDYHNYSTYGKVAILRHDVDLSIDKALLMAELEQSLGVTATYFFLLSTDFYNIASQNVQTKIKQIQNMGHEVGLHFDETKYGNLSKLGGVLPYLYDEVKIMEMIINTSVRTVSMHRPSTTTLEADYDLGEIVNSYSKLFFRDFKYVSDSRRNWREDVVKIIDSVAFNKLHILTHPFWYNEKELTMEQSISGFVNDANIKRYKLLEKNFSNLHEVMAETEVGR